MLKYGEETKTKVANKQNKVLNEFDKIINKSNNNSIFNEEEVRSFMNKYEKDLELFKLLKEKLAGKIKKVMQGILTKK